MVMGERLRDLREQKKLSQGDIQNRTGLLRCYISRVENGHTIPSVDTLEKMARALEIPIYRLFTEDVQVKKPDLPQHAISRPPFDKKQEREIQVFAKLLSRMDDKNRTLLLHLASKMANKA